MRTNQINELKPGQIRYAYLKGDVALQGGYRPVLIAQNQIGCVYSPRIWVIPLTTKVHKRMPMHVFVKKTQKNGLHSDSIALVEQAAFVLREDIKDLIGVMEPDMIHQCGNAWIRNCDIFGSEIIDTVNSITERNVA